MSTNFFSLLIISSRIDGPMTTMELENCDDGAAESHRRRKASNNSLIWHVGVSPVTLDSPQRRPGGRRGPMVVYGL